MWLRLPLLAIQCIWLHWYLQFNTRLKKYTTLLPCLHVNIIKTMLGFAQWDQTESRFFNFTRGWKPFFVNSNWSVQQTFTGFSCFLNFVLQTLPKSALWRRKKKEPTPEDSVAQCARREWKKKSCCPDIVEASERPARRQPWGGRRYRSPGSWMRGTGRWVSLKPTYLPDDWPTNWPTYPSICLLLFKCQSYKFDRLYLNLEDNTSSSDDKTVHPLPVWRLQSSFRPTPALDKSSAAVTMCMGSKQT